MRPGNGYTPEFPIFSKVDVNGSESHPIFQVRISNPLTCTVKEKHFEWLPKMANCVNLISVAFRQIYVKIHCDDTNMSHKTVVQI